MNVSVVSGFSLGDCEKNGMSVIVTTRGDAPLAKALARDIAQKAWDDRHRYIPRLTTLADATRMAARMRARSVEARAALRRRGRQSRRRRARQHGLDPRGVPQGRRAGRAARASSSIRRSRRRRIGSAGARSFHARFNRDEHHALSGKFEADAQVLGLHDGALVGKRGISAGHTINLGPMALLQVGGIRVVVVSIRQQCKDTAMFECFGIDIAQARSVIVKSRGHFRAAFDLLFPDERIVEVDVPGPHHADPHARALQERAAADLPARSRHGVVARALD